MLWTGGQPNENPFSDSASGRGGYTPPSAGATAMPPWLQDTTPQNSSTPYTPPQFSSGQYAQIPTATTAEAAPQVGLDPAVPKMILYTRVINLALSVAMIMVSLLSLLTTQSATTGVLACYVVVFACLLCCFETHLKQVSKVIALNFGFLYSAKSRCAFMIFIGTIMFSMSLFGKLIGLAMLVNAGFNIFILFKYPQFEDAQRNHAQAEIKDYLAAHPAFAQQILNVGVTAGVDILKSNPDLAKQGTQAAFAAASAPPPQHQNSNFASV